MRPRRPKLIQPGRFEGPAAAWAPRRDTFPEQSPAPVHLRVVGEHDFRTRSHFRLVEHKRQRPVDVAAYPHASSARAFRRAEDAVDQQPSTRPDHRTLPFRPDQLPPAVPRWLPQLALARPDLVLPDVQRHVVKLPVPLKPVAVVNKTVQMFVDLFKGRASRDAFPGSIRRKPVLPDLMHPLDLAFRLGRVREHERDVDELQPLAELGQRPVVVPEEPRLVHVYLEGKPVP